MKLLYIKPETELVKVLPVAPIAGSITGKSPGEEDGPSTGEEGGVSAKGYGFSSWDQVGANSHSVWDD